MRKLICSDGEQCNQGNPFRSYRRATLDEFGTVSYRKESRYDLYVTHAQALKNEICVFAKKIFAELQMTVSSASMKPDATLKESDAVERE
jgi:hypothetical protein